MVVTTTSGGLRTARWYRTEVMRYRRRRTLCALGLLIAGGIWVALDLLGGPWADFTPIARAVWFGAFALGMWHDGAVHGIRRMWLTGGDR